MATTYEDFLKAVQAKGGAAGQAMGGPNQGWNYRLEGMTPEQAWSTFMSPTMTTGGADPSTTANSQYLGPGASLSPDWQEGAIDTKAGFLGNFGPALAMLAAPYAVSATGLGAVEGATAGATGATGAGTVGAGLMEDAAGNIISTGANSAFSGGLGAAGTAAGATGAVSPVAATAGTSGFGSMDVLKSVIPGLAKTVVGGALTSALGPKTTGSGSAVNTADPFTDQRAQYQPMLQQMMTGTFSPSDPSYDWRFKQGQQALERSAAAKGMLGSGNLLQALVDYGQGQASTEYSNQFDRLAMLSGAKFGPGAAGQIAQQNAQTQSGNAAAFTNLVLGGAGKLYDTWSSSTPSTTPNLANFGGYEDLQF